MIFIGIDPGAAGGLAATGGPGATMATTMPATELDILDWLRRAAASSKAFAVIEKVGGFMGGKDEGGVHVNKAPAPTMFNFGKNYGGLRMALTAAGIPFDDVPPARWQKAHGISSRGKSETKVQFKNRLKQKAQQLFPGVKVTLSVADALLLAAYARTYYKLGVQADPAEEVTRIVRKK